MVYRGDLAVVVSVPCGHTCPSTKILTGLVPRRRGSDLRRGFPHRVVLRDQRGSVSNCGGRRGSVGSQRVLRFCRRVLCHVGHRVRGVFRAAALAGARTRLLPRWLCWFGAAAGAIQLLYTVNLIAAHGELANGARWACWSRCSHSSGSSQSASCSWSSSNRTGPSKRVEACMPWVSGDLVNRGRLGR
jgi:hypothetical protein